MSDWPPALTLMKSEMSIEETDTRDDAGIQLRLDSAVAFVERVRLGEFDFEADPMSELPAVTTDIVLGTIMLARRWWSRRNSPGALIEYAEIGGVRVPSFDPDIDRLLGIGRFMPARFA